MIKLIEKVLAHRQVVQAQKAKNQRELKNRVQRKLILQGLEDRG